MIGNKEKIETETATLFIKDNIIHTIYKSESDVTIDDIEANFKIRNQLQQGKKMLVLADVSQVWQFSKKAREFSGSTALSNITTAMGIVIGYSMPVRILANFFMNFNKPKTPTKLFKTEEKALSWLESF